MSKALDGEPSDLSPSLAADALATIETHGDPIRSWARLLSPVVKEAKLHVAEDGLRVTAVDPANVLAVDIHAPASGFEDYNITEETVVGLNLDRFQDAINWARKRHGDGDPVAIEVLDDPSRLRVTITRDDQQMQRVSEWFDITPSSIRKEPNLPDLTLHNRATPGVDALADAIDGVTTNHNHAYLARDGTDLLVASTPDGDTTPEEPGDSNYDSDPQDAVTLASVAWDDRDDDAAEAASTWFSLDYFADVTDTLDDAKADHVTLKWDDDYPAYIAFEYEDWGFNGRYMLAPRIQKGDD